MVKSMFYALLSFNIFIKRCNLHIKRLACENATQWCSIVTELYSHLHGADLVPFIHSKSNPKPVGDCIPFWHSAGTHCSWLHRSVKCICIGWLYFIYIKPSLSFWDHHHLVCIFKVLKYCWFAATFINFCTNIIKMLVFALFFSHNDCLV